jgi:hypothetical protein
MLPVNLTSVLLKIWAGWKVLSLSLSLTKLCRPFS